VTDAGAEAQGPWQIVHELDERPLVLPPALEARLSRAVAAVPLRGRVAKELGYGKLLGYGMGSVLLFEGEPGTGKTLAAHTVARRLGAPLMIVAAATLHEKYVGETEKLIQSIFEVARAEDAVLLVDEADSILRARTHADRSWEISQVNVLLRCLEELEGAVVLTTNLVESLDPALARRVTLHLRFPRPGPHERAAIWRALTDGRIRLPDAVDIEHLAHRHELTGGEIKNAVLDLAVIAVERGDRHVTEAELFAAIAEVSPGFDERPLLGFR
jgi:ATP-dependent 26S proteasome regulatory subunit